eukprot:s4491_g2.t1
MYYERSLTNLALAFLPTFAALLTAERRANGGEIVPGGAMSELIRIGALQLITKDQIMNLAVELLPPRSQALEYSVDPHDQGFQEWDQIRHRRRRAIGDLIMAYLTTARLDSGGFVAEALNLHRMDLDSLERETHLVSYACRYNLEEVERFRATFYSEDRTLNLAASQWELTHACLQSPTEDASADM